MKIYKIPKDPRTYEIIFLRNYPEFLNERIKENEWHDIIDNLNKIISEDDKISVWNILFLILILPILFNKRTFEKQVKEYLEIVNKRIKNYGIEILNPNNTSYTELEICVK